jgi:hypothetical protein
MSHATVPPESPGTTVPGSAPVPASAPDVSQQIAELTAAVNRLVQSQSQQHQARPDSVAPAAAADIGGDLPGGAPLVPAVDYARLSPLQQITLGLRDAKPVGVTRPGVAQGTPMPRDSDASSQGAD